MSTNGDQDLKLRCRALTAIDRAIVTEDLEIRKQAALSLAVLLSTSVKTSSGLPRAKDECVDVGHIVAQLSHMVTAHDPQDRQAACNALGGLAKSKQFDPTPEFIGALSDEQSHVRLAAIKAIDAFQRGIDPALPALFLNLAESKDPVIISACKTCLQRAPLSDSAVPTLIAGLESQNEEVRMQAMMGLARLHKSVDLVMPTLLDKLRTGDRAERFRAAEILGEFRQLAEPSVSELIKILGEPIDQQMLATLSHPATWDPSNAAARSLGAIAPGTASADSVIDALAEMLRSENGHRRSAAGAGLSSIGSAAQRTLADLIGAITEAIAQKKYATSVPGLARALSAIAPKTPAADQAVALLVEALSSDDDPAVRRVVVDALGRFGGEATGALDTLSALTTDPNESVRAAALKSLRSITEPKKRAAED